MNNGGNDNKIETKIVLVLLVIAFFIGYSSGKGKEGLKINEDEFPYYDDLSYEDYENGSKGFDLKGYADDLLEFAKEEYSECLASIINYEDKNYDWEESPYSVFYSIGETFDEKCKIE